MKENNTQWTWAPPQLVSGDRNEGANCLAHATSGPLVLNGSVVGRPWLGAGGLAAIGGARLLYNYPEPQRTEILDLMFRPGNRRVDLLCCNSFSGHIYFMHPARLQTLEGRYSKFLRLRSKAMPTAATAPVLHSCIPQTLLVRPLRVGSIYHG